MNIRKELGQLIKSEIKEDEPMAKHTSWKVGGPADYFVCPGDSNELIEIVRYCRERSLPICVVGNGSNLLVLDGGIRGLVVKIAEPFSYVKRSDNRLEAGAGTPMTYLARTAAEQGLAGLEFCVGIPGLLGGALIMNAGSFGGYIGEKVTAVKVVSPAAELVTLQRGELTFSYRSSNLVRKGIVVEVSLELKQGNPQESLKLMEHFISERGRRHPSQPSAGSVFRNMPDQPAGKIIEEIGCKGMRIGGAEVSCKHANFIVNTGDASAADILALIEAVRLQVREEHNLELQPEVKIVGEEK